MRKLLVFLVWLAVITPAMAAVLFSDTFDRADTSGTMNDASGKLWKDITANAEIAGNHVRCKVTQACSAVGALVSNETVTQAYVVVSALMLDGANPTPIPGTGGIGCRHRGSDSSSRNFMDAFFLSAAAGYRIDKVVAGTRTTLTVDATGDRLASARIQLLCIGNDFTLYENGVLIKGPVTDTALPTGVAGFYDAAHAVAGNQIMDNFAVCGATTAEVTECDDFSRTGIAAAATGPGGPSGKSLLGVGN